MLSEKPSLSVRMTYYLINKYPKKIKKIVQIIAQEYSILPL